MTVVTLLVLELLVHAVGGLSLVTFLRGALSERTVASDLTDGSENTRSSSVLPQAEHPACN